MKFFNLSFILCIVFLSSKILSMDTIDPQQKLLNAIKQQSSIAIKHSLDAGANVNAVDKWGYSPLHHAAMQGNSEITQFLLSNGAVIDLVDRNGDTPLIFATINGHDEVVQILLDNGTNVNHIGRFEYTPLIWAAMYGRDKILKMLLDRGAIFDKKCEQIAITHALERKHSKVVETLAHNGINYVYKKSSTTTEDSLKSSSNVNPQPTIFE